MLYRFPYKYLPPLEIPDRNLIGIFEGGNEKPSASPEEIVTRALNNPIEAPLLSDMAEGKKKALILCDDNTRQTPAHLVLPHIIDELHLGGMTNKQIQILIASGTHRSMSREELAAKLGKSVVETFTVEQHNHDAAEELVPVGVKHGEVEILINRRLKEADLIIGMGNIVPHSIKGFSGGSNIVLPGVSGGDAIGAMHWLNLKQFGEEILGKRDNIVRSLIDEVAVKAGLNYIVNTVVNNNTEIIDAVAGDPIEAHRMGTLTSSRLFTIPIPEKADIVIFDAYQNDLDFWQSTKGLLPAYICTKKDGVIIDVAECPEGICHNIPEIEQVGFKDLNKIMELHNEGVLQPIITHFLITVYRVVTEHGKCIMVSNGITRGSAEHTGLLFAENPQEALNKALEMKGRDASIIILSHAGNICPDIQDKSL